MNLTSTTLHVVADDKARLALHLTRAPHTDPLRAPSAGADRPPLVCVPGGPMLGTRYLGDLGGLSTHLPLALLDNRGSGGSDAPAHPSAYRCDRLVPDLEAVRRRLGLDRLDLLGHSAGANTVLRYAERHPDRVGRLVLLAPSPFALGIDIPVRQRRDVLEQRRDEPWFPAALAAFEAVQTGAVTAADRAALAPLTHGSWDERTAAYDAGMDAERDHEAATWFGSDGAFDPPRTRAALRALTRPVLVVAGALDVGNPPPAMTALAEVFPDARLVIVPGAAHYPWRDRADLVRSEVVEFLDGGAADA